MTDKEKLKIAKDALIEIRNVTENANWMAAQCVAKDALQHIEENKPILKDIDYVKLAYSMNRPSEVKPQPPEMTDKRKSFLQLKARVDEIFEAVDKPECACYGWKIKNFIEEILVIDAAREAGK